MIRKLFTKTCSLVLAVTMVAGLSLPASARGPVPKKLPKTESLRTGYQQIMSYAAQNNIELGLSYDGFVQNYDGQPMEDYLDTYYSVLRPEPIACRSVGSFSGSSYYYNTGSVCPTQANYDRYNLLDVVQKGDVIFEANGGYGITAHIAIVEGIYPRNDGTGRSYIRLIEALSNSYGGVTRSILDDTRVDDKAVTILRVKGAAGTKIDRAVSFCQGELGSSYFLDFAKDYSASETDWYCSELVWATYYNQGINIEVGGLHGEPGVTPRDILRCKLTEAVPYSAR